MERICRSDGIRVEISREEVFRALACEPGSAAYQIVSEEYDKIEEEVAALCRPMLLVQPGKLPKWPSRQTEAEEDSVLYALCTIGRGAEKLCTEAFAQGDYVKGMLVNAMADSALFSLERELEAGLRRCCLEQKTGIRKRLEAPADLPMEMQKEIYEAVGAADFGIRISEGYMFDPVKSQAMIFLLTEDASQMQTHHDCAGCDCFDCPRRQAERLTVTVKEEGSGRMRRIACRAGENLLCVLQREGIRPAAPCGGRGHCGKCRVRVIKGKIAAAKKETEVLSEKLRRQGWHLACQAEVRMNLEIMLPGNEEEFQVLNAFAPEAGERTAEQEAEGWGIAIDLGTTTIAMQRISLADGAVLDTWNSVNHQRSYGADVISRIEASVNGKREELRACIREDLASGIREIGARAGGFGKMKSAALAGNTVMLHLLRGYDCTGLTGVPFSPESLTAEMISMRELIAQELPDVGVYLFPGAAAFVGGDITAGLYDCGFEEDPRIRMLIDLGTNGELVLGNRERLLCASTAAGPAFEGGRIAWGMGSLPGAIQGAELLDGRIRIQTIGGADISRAGREGLSEAESEERMGADREEDMAGVSGADNGWNGLVTAAGICGTGVLETAALLYELGYMDETGRLEDEFFDEGYPLARTASGEVIRITQQDIREIQLAKAAIRAGIDTLLYHFGIQAEQVEEICLAGGFGFALDCEKAMTVGLLPEGFRGRIRVVGNSSLGGCIRFLGTGHPDILKNLTERMEEKDLSADRVFGRYYIERMVFGE